MVESIYQYTINKSIHFTIVPGFYICFVFVFVYFLHFLSYHAGHFYQSWCNNDCDRNYRNQSMYLFTFPAVKLQCLENILLQCVMCNVHTIMHVDVCITIGSNSEHNENNSSFRFFVESNQAICPKG